MNGVPGYQYYQLYFIDEFMLVMYHIYMAQLIFREFEIIGLK